MNSMNIKGKQYIPVNERLKHFRSEDKYEGYSLTSEIYLLNEVQVIMKATITDDKGKVVAEGFAQEEATDDYKKVNSTSMIENCETSAWGRALGNLGIGIDVSVASADEVSNATRRQASNSTRREVAPQDFEDNNQVQTEKKDFDLVFWDGVSPLKKFDHFYANDILYKTMQNKTTQELFGLAVDENVSGNDKFYKLA